MAKTMARIQGGTVINIEWYNDYAEETEELKFAQDIPVSIGDSYREGKWYRPDGTEILTPLEEEYQMNAEFDAAMREIEIALGVAT